MERGWELLNVFAQHKPAMGAEKDFFHTTLWDFFNMLRSGEEDYE